MIFISRKPRAVQRAAKTVVAADFGAPGDNDVINKVRADLGEKGIAATEAELRTEIERAAADARRQIAQS